MTDTETDVNPLTELLRPHVAALQADDGNKAKQVIQLYQMYVKCPSDHGAAALCEAAFKDWHTDQK